MVDKEEIMTLEVDSSQGGNALYYLETKGKEAGLVYQWSPEIDEDLLVAGTKEALEDYILHGGFGDTYKKELYAQL